MQAISPKRIEQYGVLEVAVHVEAPDVANPFTDARVVVEFAGQDRTYSVQGFCDTEDGTLWRVRFCPTSPGDYQYTAQYRNCSGSVAVSGAFTCDPSPAGHGFVRRDPAHPMHFVHDDGTHVFLAGKTAWRLGCSPYWREFIDQASTQRMNVLRVGVEWTGWPDLTGGVCWVWGGTPKSPDFSRFNLSQWRHWDEVLIYAFERGVLIEPCVFTDIPFRRRPAQIPDQEMELYWDYLLARWGAYPGILLWELYNEFTGKPDFQAYMARYFHEHDVYRRLVTTSAGPIGEEPFPDEGWNDILVPHYCVGSWMHLDAFYRHYALHHRRYGKPVYIDETGRVGGTQHNNDGEHRRKQYWIWAVSGDYCNYHSRGGCHVTLEREPGEQYWPHYVAFWHETEWWRMTPVTDPIAYPSCSQVRAYALTAPNSAIVYLCSMDTGLEVPAGQITLPMRPGRYRCMWYNPSTGNYAGPEDVSSDGSVYLSVPAFRDDLAIRLDSSAG